MNYFPYFNPPPPARHVPPPPPSSASPPPPSPPHVAAPPPPHVLPPPQPHPFAPPSPHIRPPPTPLPPSPSPHHPTIIVIVFISCGGLFFFAFMATALFCFLKKRKKKKTVQESEIVRFDEHREVKEEMVEGPHGTEAIIVSIEDDIHFKEEVKKSDQKVGEISSLGAKETEGASTAVEGGGISSSVSDHHQNHSRRAPPRTQD